MEETFRTALESLGEKAPTMELAFFGGSFTAIDPAYRLALLQAAQPYIGPGSFSGIRVSTRPDCIDPGIVKELVDHGVTTVELGAQSMDDEVLAANRRGHTGQDTRRAARLIRESGLGLGLQMMTGLYRDDHKGALATAQSLADLEPDMVRIYPTLVLSGTHLEELYSTGTYRPQTLEEAVELGARLLALFEKRSIPVIRLGLQDEPGIRQQLVAGPYHPALRELCEARLMLERVVTQLKEHSLSPGPLAIGVHPRSISKMTGQKRGNIRALEEMGYRPRIFSQEGLEPLEPLVLGSPGS